MTKVVNTEFVVDASFTGAWCFIDEATVGTRFYLDVAMENGVVVPVVWKLEVANFLRMAERRRRISVEDADLQLENFKSLVVREIDQGLEQVWTKTLALARKHNLTVYDASYVELARQHSLPLASLDKAMIAAARSEKVEVLSV